MGKTLSTTADWTLDGAGGKLELNEKNGRILTSVIEFCEAFNEGHRDEMKLFFKHPLCWKTQLVPSDFSGPYTVLESEVTSEETGGPNNLPALTVKETGELSVSNFAQIQSVLKIAGDSGKYNETRCCLESNPDPAANMLGQRFASVEGADSSIESFVEEFMREKTDMSQKQEEGADEKRLAVNMLLAINNLDNNLMQQAQKITKDVVRLNAKVVRQEMQLLQSLAGRNPDRNVVAGIAYAEPYTHEFSNGCRAPYWRQIHGDICYLSVELLDSEDETICITANTNGYFINMGYDEAKNHLNFEQDGNYYRDLVALLSERSSKFAANIAKQRENAGVRQLYDVRHRKEFQPRGDAQAAQNKPRDQTDEDDGPLSGKKRGKDDRLEPSLQWKSLGLGKGEEDDRGLTTSQQRARRTGGRRYSDEDTFSESSSESDEEEEVPERRQESAADLPSEYWQIQKLVKYLKGGNQTATVIALCALCDFDLTQETCQLAIRDVGGLEVLINLLDTEEPHCKMGALMILKEISQNPQIRRAIADLGGLQTMVKILSDPNKDLKCLAAETIANVAKFRRARRTVRQHGGIKRLVALLDKTSNSRAEQQKDADVARCGALALWSCSKSTRNKNAMRKAGVIPLLARLLKSNNDAMLIPVIGTLQECASESSYRMAIRTEGMVEDLVRGLKTDNPELQMHCANAIFKCAEDSHIRDLVRQHRGLNPLVKLLQKQDQYELLAAVTGAIWKCAVSQENAARFQELKTVEQLVNLLNDQPEEVLINVVGAISELAKDAPNRATVRRAGGISSLIGLLTGTNTALLVNVTGAVGQCAEEPENMAMIDKLDGVRLLWSLLKNPHPGVQAGAAWALCPCITNAKDSGEMVRSFVGGLELIVNLLKSEHLEVQAAVCAAIACIANDEENLAVITDHGVVSMVSRLTNTTSDRLRRHLAEAIARCCNWGKNRQAFGDQGAVAPLVHYLKSKDPCVHRSTASALHQLSRDPDNCITMHEAGVVKPLLEMVGSDDEALQDAAAGCLFNIRKLAIANEKAMHG